MAARSTQVVTLLSSLVVAPITISSSSLFLVNTTTPKYSASNMTVTEVTSVYTTVCPLTTTYVKSGSSFTTIGTSLKTIRDTKFVTVACSSCSKTTYVPKETSSLSSSTVTVSPSTISNAIIPLSTVSPVSSSVTSSSATVTSTLPSTVLPPVGTTCVSTCFQLMATGSSTSAFGSTGQLSDGQIRLGGNHPSSTYCIKNTSIVDASGRGCVVTTPESQFQCDLNSAAQPGFTIGPSGALGYNANDTFYACPVNGEHTEWNIYINPLAGEPSCVSIRLIARGYCSMTSVNSTSLSSSSISQTTITVSPPGIAGTASSLSQATITVSAFSIISNAQLSNFTSRTTITVSPFPSASSAQASSSAIPVGLVSPSINMSSAPLATQATTTASASKTVSTIVMFTGAAGTYKPVGALAAGAAALVLIL